MKRKQRVNYIKFQWGTDAPELIDFKIVLVNIIFGFNADLLKVIVGSITLADDAYYGAQCLSLTAYLSYKMGEQRTKTLNLTIRTPGGNLIKATQSDVHGK